jgi:dinuclear metal center YbgI/SA1388 family protein
MARMTTVGDLTAALERRFPLAWAEPWDRVGLIAGDPSAEVRRVFVTLDATPVAVARASAAGCQAIITHHPPALDDLSRLTPDARARGSAFAAVSARVALIVAHTNLDRSPEGADALSAALGLTIEGPLETGGQAVRLVTVYVPESAIDAVHTVMSDAGAGSIGRYSGCAFISPGEGRFIAGTGASPAVATDGAGVAEARLEMVCAQGAEAAVIAAARDSHPYEEPVILTADATIDRGVARLGRVCVSPTSTTLSGLAAHIAARLGSPVRVWGPPDAPVSCIAVANGSAGSLLGAAIGSGADVMVAGELRYHDALDASLMGLAVIEAGHDITEWPLIRVLADAVRAELADVGVDEDRQSPQWWIEKENND